MTEFAIHSPASIPKQRVPLVGMMSANAISLVGNSLSGIAIPWFVLATTGSASKTGITAFVGMLPVVLGGLFGGTVVDRLGHKRTSIFSDLASGLTVATIPLLYHTVGIAFWQLLILVFLGALFDSPGGTARLALIPALSEKAGTPIERVNAASQTISSLSLLIGPPIAGALIVVLGTSNVLWLDAASFAVSAAIIARAVPSSPTAKPEAKTGYLTDLKEGLHFITGDRLLRAILIPASVINFLAAPLFGVVLPVFAARTYGDAIDLGVMLGGFGAGSVIGSLIYGAVGVRFSKRRTLIVAFLLSGLPFWGLALQPPVAVAVGLLALNGLLLSPINPIVMTAIQTRTPPALLGRVIGVVIAMATGLAPLGMLTSGASLDLAGVTVTLCAIAAGFLIVALFIARSPHLTELDRIPAS